MAVGWDVPYLQSIWDIYSGTKSGIPHNVSYCNLCRELKEIYERKIDTNIVKKYNASDLWCLQMAQKTKVNPMECGDLLVTGKVYTGNYLGRKLLIMTDVEDKCLIQLE